MTAEKNFKINEGELRWIKNRKSMNLIQHRAEFAHLSGLDLLFFSWLQYSASGK
jgi:hypothetical protein